MTDEGVRILSRLALLTVLILAAAAFRTVVGPSKRRGSIAAAGTIGGFALGVLLSPPVSRWFGADVSAIGVCIGIIVGWAVAYQFIKQIPRNAT